MRETRLIVRFFMLDDKALYGKKAIEENKLERIENHTQHRRYKVEFTCPELTCLCPKSGFPDFATLFIQYLPHKYYVELKSLKLYINGFRDKKIFHEDLVNVVLDDLITLLDPWEIYIQADFNVRGNIKTVVKAEHKK